MLNQRLGDMKKTLQNELKINMANSKSTSGTTTLINRMDNENVIDKNRSNSTVVMDDVNFKYLKHVILKFLTSREVNFIYINSEYNDILNYIVYDVGRGTPFNSSYWYFATTECRRRAIIT